MIRLELADLKATLELTPESHNIMLVGKHGIGKSQVLTNYFEQQGMRVVTLFLGQMADPGDLIGLPHLDEVTGKTDFMPPYWFPTDGKPIVLFLDELNRARPEILQTVMDLTLNRRLAGKALPMGSRIIAAVNDGEEYQLTDLDPALVSRFNIYEFLPTVQEWLTWAASHGIDERVVNFIQDNPLWLDGEALGQAKKYNGLEKQVDRRGWERVSDILRQVDKIEQVHMRVIGGIIGAAATAELVRYANEQKVITGKDLLLDYEKTMKKVAHYQLHEYATLNESIFRFLETAGMDEREQKLAAKNLTQYLEYLKEYKMKEAFANFVSIFEKDTYTKAQTFMVMQASDVYVMLTDFIEEL